MYKRQIRQSKNDTLVDEVELLEASTQYAHVRVPGVKESTVSTKSLVLAEHSADPSREAFLEPTQYEAPPEVIVHRRRKTSFPLRRSSRTTRKSIRLTNDQF